MSDATAHALDQAQAIWLYPSLQGLVLIRDAGWKFLPIEEDDDTAALEGFRVWPDGWRDCIRVRGETDALGLRIRMPADQHSAADIVWEFSGTLTEVVEKLMELEMPGTRLAPSLVIGTAPGLWTP